MLKLDTLNQLKQLKHDIKASRNLSLGTVKGSAYKFGFVTLDSGRDVYLPPDEMERVLPGDRVEVEIVKDAKNKKVAKLEKLIESPTRVFCGKYITKGKAAFIEPDIAGMSRWFFVPPQKRKNAKAKELVKCKVTQHPYKTGKAQAAISDVIGTDQDANIEVSYACHKYQLETSWSKAEEQQVQSLSEETILSLSEGRINYCELPMVTIDSASTKDIDDALYAEKITQGWNLYVAIADPCAMIEPGSAIEKGLIKRASSVYFPGQTLPMLPEQLGSDLCSLVEEKPRLAKVVKISLNEDGKVEQFNLENALIKSHKKMTYEQVGNFIDQGDSIDGCDEKILSSLGELKAVADKRLEFRTQHNLVQTERHEFFIELDDSGKIANFNKKTFNSAHQIVEEAMVTTNNCIAELLSEKQTDGIFVSHRGVRSDRIEVLNQVLLSNVEGYQDNALTSLEGFIASSKQLSNEPDYQLLMSRQLEKSSLSISPAPHFGMGLTQYCNFTSPLRKATDFLVHRQLDNIATNKPSAISEPLLQTLEENTARVKGASYDVEQWLKCQYLAKNTASFDATVHRIFSSGFQVKLLENGIEGFVSTKDMEAKFSFNQELLTLTSKELSLKLNQNLKVKLKQIDWSRKQLQFEIA
jgi:ribonuclease R